MPKQHARNVSIYLDSAAGASTSLTGDGNSITLDLSAEAPDVTSFGDNTVQRLSGGITDWTLSYEGFFNQGATAAACIVEALVAGSSFLQLGVTGSTTGCPKKAASCVLTSFNLSWGIQDAVSMSFEVTGRTGSITASAW